MSAPSFRRNRRDHRPGMDHKKPSTTQRQNQNSTEQRTASSGGKASTNSSAYNHRGKSFSKRPNDQRYSKDSANDRNRGLQDPRNKRGQGDSSHPVVISNSPDLTGIAGSSNKRLPDRFVLSEGKCPRPDQAPLISKYSSSKTGKPDVLTPIKRTQNTEKPSAFQRLPPEIRWQIYGYLFPPRRVEIFRSWDTKPTRRLRYRLYHRPCPLRNPRTQAVMGKFWAGSSLSSPLALASTCRIVYCETILLLYSTIQFTFNSTKAASRFLNMTSQDAKAAIRHIELSHTMYNEPRLTNNRIFKHRSDLAWFEVCEGIAKAMKSLQVLHINLEINDWPIRLEIGERWSLPLVVFGEREKRLNYARIQLKMRMFHREKLQAVAHELEANLMTPASLQIREDEVLAERLMGDVKARKCLVLTF